MPRLPSVPAHRESFQVTDEVRCLWPAAAVLGEGGLWSVSRRSLFWVDILSRHIHRLDPATGARQSWTFDEEVSALAERRTGEGLAIALRRGPAFWNPDQPGQPPRYLCQPEPERSDNRFNDARCDAAGRWWMGSMDFGCALPTGSLYRVGADGAWALRFTSPAGEQTCRLRIAGRHNVRNALAAAAIALGAGVALDTIVAGLGAARPVAGRLVTHVLPGGARLIDDSYNANPGSLDAAIDIYGRSERNKYRAVVYYMLVKHFGNTFEYFGLNWGCHAVRPCRL